jgi:hypothetical protein
MLPTKFQFIWPEGFQRRRLKCEKLTDDGRRWRWQKLTLSLARRAKNIEPHQLILNIKYSKFQLPVRLVWLLLSGNFQEC